MFQAQKSRAIDPVFVFVSARQGSASDGDRRRGAYVPQRRARLDLDAGKRGEDVRKSP
jgi:hypothetical protein